MGTWPLRPHSGCTSEPSPCREKVIYFQMCPRHCRVCSKNTVVVPLNWKWKKWLLSGIKYICRRGRNWFALHTSSLHWAPYNISLSWIGVSLLTITSKYLTVFEVPDLQVYCEVDCIAEHLIELHGWQLWSPWLKFEWMSSLLTIGTKFFWLNTFMGLSNPSQMRWPRYTYVSTRRSAFHASVASYFCIIC